MDFSSIVTFIGLAAALTVGGITACAVIAATVYFAKWGYYEVICWFDDRSYPEEERAERRSSRRNHPDYHNHIFGVHD